MPYDKGCHTVFHHRYHLVWITKYRYKVLKGAVRKRVREILRQVCEELGVTIVNGVLSVDHVHMCSCRFRPTMPSVTSCAA